MSETEDGAPHLHEYIGSLIQQMFMEYHMDPVVSTKEVLTFGSLA